MSKTRIDKYLADNNLSESREKAKREIIAGWVKVNGETVRDPSRTIAGTEEIIVARPQGLYVSRGGEKLAKAISEFSLTLQNMTTLDLGASTGGFTDCMLKNGAVKVYAIDVGYGQLDYSLRTDSRVVSHERMNARAIEKDIFHDKIDFITADLSFISFTKVFPRIQELFPATPGVALLKPQFESESKEGFKGVVRKEKDHIQILQRVISRLIELGMQFIDITFSPIKGPKGNIEYLLYYKTTGDNSDVDGIMEKVSQIVKKSHLELNKDENSLDIIEEE